MSTTYTDKHSKKLQVGPTRTNSEDKKLTNKENYINYLEHQLEKTQESNDEKLQSIQQILMEHDDKIESIIKLVKLLQSFAETQEQENGNIREFVMQQINFLYERDFGQFKEIISNNEKGLNQASQCIVELQQAFQEIERQRQEFELKVEEHISKASNDIQNDFKLIQTQFGSPRTDLTQLETQLNRKVEIIMSEIRQTALQKDLQQIDYRLRNVESINNNDSVGDRNIRKDLDDLRMALNQLLNDQQNIKYQMDHLPIQLRDEMQDLEKKQNKKISSVIDRISYAYDTQQMNQKYIYQNINKNSPRNEQSTIQVNNLSMSKEQIIPRPKSKSKEKEHKEPSQDRQGTNQSLDFLPQKGLNLSKKNILNKKKSEKSISIKREKSRSKGRNQSSVENQENQTLNKLEALRKTKENQVKEMIRRRKQLSPNAEKKNIDKNKRSKKKIQSDKMNL